MKVIIAGSRSLTLPRLVEAAMEEALVKGIVPTKIISGNAYGIDQLGEAWARARSIELIVMPAPWSKYGMGAGYRRNSEMAAIADALVAIWDTKSRGTLHMINTMKALNKSVYVKKCQPVKPVAV